MNDKSLKRIGIFAQEIVHLISYSKKEKVRDIEEHFDSNNLVEYLYTKYKSDFSNSFDGKNPENEAINAYFNQYAGYIVGNEDRKYGIKNEDDGLLLILALIFEKVKDECHNWSISE